VKEGIYLNEAEREKSCKVIVSLEVRVMFPLHVWIFVYVCVCEREREREIMRESQKSQSD
jgi:hypothetical protein